jgi:hypothetical protein
MKLFHPPQDAEDPTSGASYLKAGGAEFSTQIPIGTEFS